MISKITVVFIFFVLGYMAQADTLDWNKVNWSKGGEEQTFYDVDGSGIDITITLTLSYDSATYNKPHNHKKGYSTQTDWIDGGPDDNNTFGGDGSKQTGESLYLGLNFASDNRKVSYLDARISFSKSVSNVNFSLFDVDAYGYNYKGGYEKGIQFVDVIEYLESDYQGSSSGSATVDYNPGKINYVNNGNGDQYYGNTILNSSADQSDNPKSALNIGWSDPVDTVSFRYTTGSSPVRDPGNQAIGLSNVSFYEYNAVPEANTVITSSFIVLGLGFMTWKRRRKRA